MQKHARQVLERQGGLGLISSEAFLDQSRQVWRDLHDGVGGLPYMVVRRELSYDRESDEKGTRRDLASYLESARTVPGMDRVLHALLDKEPQLELLREVVSPWRGVILQDLPWTQVTLHVDKAEGWPSDWGGPSSANEMRRVVTLVTNHAPWRDRRGRRLVEVLVEADEIWADDCRAEARHS